MVDKEVENCLEKTELKIKFEEIEIGTDPHFCNFSVTVGKEMEWNSRWRGTWVKRKYKSFLNLTE